MVPRNRIHISNELELKQYYLKMMYIMQFCYLTSKQMELVEAYLTSQVEVCMVCNVYGRGSCCSGFHTEDQLIVRCELICHLGENCSWESFFTIHTDITQGELVFVQIWLPHNLTQKQRESILFNDVISWSHSIGVR